VVRKTVCVVHLADNIQKELAVRGYYHIRTVGIFCKGEIAMSGSVEIIIRTLTAFILLCVFVQLLDKQTIAQKTYHLYIASITMGTIAGNLAFNIKIKFLYFIIAMIIMGAVVFMLNLVTVRNPRLGKWIAENQLP
jgi:hypothetical protein